MLLTDHLDLRPVHTLVRPLRTLDDTAIAG
jgi:hypothetical protein